MESNYEIKNFNMKEEGPQGAGNILHEEEIGHIYCGFTDNQQKLIDNIYDNNHKLFITKVIQGVEDKKITDVDKMDINEFMSFLGQGEDIEKKKDERNIQVYIFKTLIKKAVSLVLEEKERVKKSILIELKEEKKIKNLDERKREIAADEQRGGADADDLQLDVAKNEE